MIHHFMRALLYLTVPLIIPYCSYISFSNYICMYTRMWHDETEFYVFLVNYLVLCLMAQHQPGRPVHIGTEVTEVHRGINLLLNKKKKNLHAIILYQYVSISIKRNASLKSWSSMLRCPYYFLTLTPPWVCM